MREILFRAKRVNDGEWIKGFYGCLQNPRTDDGKPEKHLICCDYTPFGITVDPETIGQYTGLTDKNGTKIFEGDKVRGLFHFGMPIVGECSFQNGAFGIRWMRGEVEEFTPFCCTHGIEWEVVKNEQD